MSETPGWFQRQRAGLWHLRKRGLKGFSEWKKRQTLQKEPEQYEPAAPPMKRYDRSPRPVIMSDVSVPVVAGMATMPSRIGVLRDAFNSIYWQVDEVHVFLNNFDRIPDFLRVPRVTVYRSQDHKDYKDVGKFFPLNYLDEGILFTIDDDILYPPDYVSRMLTYLASVEYKAAVGVHGFQLPRYPKSFFDRKTLHFKRGVKNVTFASVLGTGTAAFDIGELSLSLDDFPTYGMADIHFATFLKKNSIPALVIPRGPRWLQPLADDETNEGAVNLYAQTQNNAATHSQILRSVSPWGEDDTLTRWGALNNETILTKNLVTALNIIRDSDLASESSVELGLARISRSDFRSVLSWIEFYTGPLRREEILSDLINSKLPVAAELRAVKSLWSTNAHSGVEASRGTVSRRPLDVAVLRQHANLCARYFMPDEADEYFLRAVRHSGAKGLESTPDILFEYFSFLVQFNRHESALIVATSLKPIHGTNPSFIVLMIQTLLGVDDFGLAKEWLARLLSTTTSTSPDKSLNALVWAVAQSRVRRTSSSVSLIDIERITIQDHPVEVLIALLKIATTVGDKTGAEHIWISTCNQYPDYLENHPEITEYYMSNWDVEKSTGCIEYQGQKRILAEKPAGVSYSDGPLVSVILTNYNSNETLGFAIESILQQTHRNLELIIVDDASEDNSVQIVEEWMEKDDRITLLRNPKNKGPYVSRNRALKIIQGDFVAIQDADDVSIPDRLAIQLESFTPQTMAVLGEHKRIDRQGAVQLENNGSIRGHGPVTLVFRQEVIRDMGPFCDVRTRGDKEFESRLEHFYGSFSIVRMDETLVYALDDDQSNSILETRSLDKKRDLLLFKQWYSRRHADARF